MKVAIISRTPLDGSPWELLKALRRYTSIEARLINVTDRGPDGRAFPRDLMLDGIGGEWADWIAAADLIHVHDDMDEVSALRDRKPIVAQFYSVPLPVRWRLLAAAATARYTVRRPAQEREYAPWPALPDIIDPDECRPRRRAGNSVVKLSELAGVDHERRLDMISGAGVLVDDLVEGSWTRASLEGACFGCAVVNASGLYPFVHATPETLEERLAELVEDRAMLRIVQEEARLWALQKWHAMDGVKEYEKAYREALA